MASLSDKATQVAVAAQRSELDEDEGGRFKRCQRRCGMLEAKWSTPSPTLHAGAWKYATLCWEADATTRESRTVSSDPWLAVSSCEP